MIAALCIFCLLLVVLCTMLALAWQRSKADLLATRADRDRLEHSVRHNIRGIRMAVAHNFPEAVKVCDALEGALQARCAADLRTLESALFVQRRKHNATLLDAADVQRARLRDVLHQIVCAAEAIDAGGIAAHARHALALYGPMPEPAAKGPR